MCSSLSANFVDAIWKVAKAESKEDTGCQHIYATVMHEKNLGGMYRFLSFDRGPFYDWHDVWATETDISVQFTLCSIPSSNCCSSVQQVLSFTDAKPIHIMAMLPLVREWEAERLPEGLRTASDSCRMELHKDFRLSSVCHNHLVLHRLQGSEMEQEGLKRNDPPAPFPKSVSIAAKHRADGTSHQTVPVEIFNFAVLTCRAVYAQLDGSGYLTHAPEPLIKSPWKNPDTFVRRHAKTVGKLFLKEFGKPDGSNEIKDPGKLRAMLLTWMKGQSNRETPNRVTGVVDWVSFQIPGLRLHPDEVEMICDAVVVMVIWRSKIMPLLDPQTDGFMG